MDKIDFDEYQKEAYKLISEEGKKENGRDAQFT